MISAREKQSSSSKRVVIPVGQIDRQRLHEIKEKLGSWTAVSEALGFRGASTARKWALQDSTTFKGKDYPDRIQQLHERIVGKPVKEQVPSNNTALGKRMERVESGMEHMQSMMEMLMKNLGIDVESGEAKALKKGAEKTAPDAK